MKRSTSLVISITAIAGMLAGANFAYRASVTARRTAAGGLASPGTGGSAQPVILYYRNPMGLADTSPIPKKDAMGMDYAPVYAGDESGAGTIRIDMPRLQKLGVRTEIAQPRVLTQTLRIVAVVAPDERRQSTISAKYEGWVTQIFVSTTGASVRRGQPLLEIYSPDVLSAQQDYRVAVRATQALRAGDAVARANMERLAQSGLDRLRNWNIAAQDLADLDGVDAPMRGVLLRAERDGVVTEKLARVGARFMPGDALYQITDLSTVWLVGSVFEQDLALVHAGTAVTASVVAYPGKTFHGTVTFISPVLQAETRTAQLRIELPNTDRLLKPAMYAMAEVTSGALAPRLAVPDSAVLDTGTRQLVLVDLGGGEFEPRAVRTGARADGYTEVLSGLVAREAVVVNGNFLIDSESNLRAALDGLQTHAHGAGSAPASRASALAAPPGSSPSQHAGH